MHSVHLPKPNTQYYNGEWNDGVFLLGEVGEEGFLCLCQHITKEPFTYKSFHMPLLTTGKYNRISYLTQFLSLVL